MPPRKEPVTGRWPVATGTAEIMLDDDRPGAWILFVEGVAQSSVDPDEPAKVSFDYVRTLADVTDVARPTGEPVTALHLGGGALSLPRYLAATRPGSSQLVVEVDAPLADLVREQFGVPRGTRVRIGDAVAELATLKAGRYDVIVDDAFVAGQAPAFLATLASLDLIGRALAPQGLYLANISARSGAREAWTKRLAILRQAFPYVAAAAPNRVLQGRRDGNVVVLASTAPLPLDALENRLARRPQPVSLLAE